MESWQFIQSPAGDWYWLCSNVISRQTRTSTATFKTRMECVANAMTSGYQKIAPQIHNMQPPNRASGRLQMIDGEVNGNVGGGGGGGAGGGGVSAGSGDGGRPRGGGGGRPGGGGGGRPGGGDGGGSGGGGQAPGKRSQRRNRNRSGKRGKPAN